MKPFCSPSGRHQRGVTLVELLVAMAIGLVVVLAVTSVLTIGQAQKRTTTSANDMNQSGSYASYVLDRAVRSAGSGFTQSWDLGVFGCRLSVARGGTAILPRATAFPGAFAGFLGGATGSANLRVAPALIGKSQSSGGSDVLMLMGGNAAAGDVARPVRVPGVLSANELRLDNVLAVAAGDMALMSQAGTTDCLIEQVATPSAPDVLPLGGTYYNAAAPFSTIRASGLATPSYLTPLGNVASGNVQFQLIGVDANRTLFSYDLLRLAGAGTDADATSAIAEGVLALHALYGLDTDGDGIVNQWVDPGATGFDIATMMASPALLRQVMAIRVALVLRGSNYEKLPVSPPSLILFGDLPPALQQTVSLPTVDDSHFRYRVVDSVIPVRNMLLLPTS